jgi:hypothetical protein
MLFGTFQNPRECEVQVGFFDGSSDRIVSDAGREGSGMIRTAERSGIAPAARIGLRSATHRIARPDMIV